MALTTPLAPASVSVAITSTQIVAANNDRTALHICVTGRARVALAFGTPAIYGAGVILKPDQCWKMDPNTFHDLAVFAIAGPGGSSVAVQEWELP